MRGEEKITRKGVAREVGETGLYEKKVWEWKYEERCFNWTDEVRVGLHRKEDD